MHTHVCAHMCAHTCEPAFSSRAFVGQLGSRGQSPRLTSLVPRPPFPGPPGQGPLAILHASPTGHTGPHITAPCSQATTCCQSPAPRHPFSPCHSPGVRGWRRQQREAAGLPCDIQTQRGSRCPLSSGLVPAARSTHPIPGWGPPGWCGAFPGVAGPRAQPGLQSQTWRRCPCKCRGWVGGETTGLRSEVRPGAEPGARTPAPPPWALPRPSLGPQQPGPGRPSECLLPARLPACQGQQPQHGSVGIHLGHYWGRNRQPEEQSGRAPWRRRHLSEQQEERGCVCRGRTWGGGPESGPEGIWLGTGPWQAVWGDRPGRAQTGSGRSQEPRQGPGHTG